MLRANSRLRQEIGPDGIGFLEHAAGAVNRILPHVEVSTWTERAQWLDPGAVWASNRRTELRMTVAIGSQDRGRSLTAVVQRRSVPTQQNADRHVLDLREQDICRRIARQLSNVLDLHPSAANGASLRAIGASFDEQVVAEHIREHHKLTLEVSGLLGDLHTLAEQTYENKALTFGCILDPTAKSSSALVFPKDFKAKKYRALSDGYRTAYYLSSSGQVLDFVDLDEFEFRSLTAKHFYPQWAELMARASRDGKCGIALSRQGDLLVFDEGTLRFTYRNGRWQYWNHAHLVTLLRDRARSQHVPPAFLGRIVSSVYRTALDISFRHAGGLFVVLRNRGNLSKIVRAGDAVGDPDRAQADLAFDRAMNRSSAPMHRSVMAELASLGGAVVLDNSARILAYGAVLRPRRTGRLRGSEGSRTKAAIGASHYGLSMKVSSDGDITVYHDGKQFISI
jgi:hypothetical protein